MRPKTLEDLEMDYDNTSRALVEAVLEGKNAELALEVHKRASDAYFGRKYGAYVDRRLN